MHVCPQARCRCLERSRPSSHTSAPGHLRQSMATSLVTPGSSVHHGGCVARWHVCSQVGVPSQHVSMPTEAYRSTTTQSRRSTRRWRPSEPHTRGLRSGGADGGSVVVSPSGDGHDRALASGKGWPVDPLRGSRSPCARRIHSSRQRGRMATVGPEPLEDCSRRPENNRGPPSLAPPRGKPRIVPRCRSWRDHQSPP